MKTLVSAALSVAVILCMSLSPLWAQTQVVDGYTFVRGLSGANVCLGQWVVQRDGTGSCEGQLVDVFQLSAVSSRLTADRMDQMLTVLSSMDEKLSAGNAQMQKLTEVTLKAQESLEKQVQQSGTLLQEAITARFDRRLSELPVEMLASEEFRLAMEALKQDILDEVEKFYVRRPAVTTKPK